MSGLIVITPSPDVVVVGVGVDGIVDATPAVVDVVESVVVIAGSVVRGQTFAPQLTVKVASSPSQPGVDIDKSTVKLLNCSPPPPQVRSHSDHSVQTPSHALGQTKSSQGALSEPPST